MVSSEGACAAAYLYNRLGDTREERAQLKKQTLFLNNIFSADRQKKEDKRKALLNKGKLRILFLTHTFNSLTQRLFVELTQEGHDVSIEFDINDEVTMEAVSLFAPDIIIAPYLKRAIPEILWKEYICLVVHPGIKGDRGPNALDWAILENQQRWAVTVLEANGEMDAGDIYSSIEFPMRLARKSSLYRYEVTEAALKAVKNALARLKTGQMPEPLDYTQPNVRGRLQPTLKQQDRLIDWTRDSTTEVLRKIHSADGSPGVLDELCGRKVYLFDAHPESHLRGKPGDLLAQRYGAICRATVDGAVWITHLKLHDPSARSKTFKLPAVTVLKEELPALPESTVDLFDEVDGLTWREIWYKEDNAVGYLYFEFYNGAMSTQQCLRLREAVLRARKRPIKVLVLLGGCDFWSNGIHLNVIEASHSPADESWNNINAMNDLVESILTTKDQLTIAALRGNAGAGGVFLALAADRILARRGIIFNPHYKSMGNLYGSEYWTYLLPKRVGSAQAGQITQNRLPIGACQAARMGLIDEYLDLSSDDFEKYVKKEASALAFSVDFPQLLRDKANRRSQDESQKSLQEYRQEELERMKLNFYGFDPSYHVARYNFVYKVSHSWTPLQLARHRHLNQNIPVIEEACLKQK
ncbi:MAG: hydrogenase maturation protein [Candidatus Omnitrophica bacterium]|nr:hydrogenase maturation protein [Candidatus Omnitrophota bacterium]